MPALITYGAPTLLAKPGGATPRFRRGAANIGAHEIAHQWFGNLVSPMWWDDLWLNEAFATWFAEKIVDQWRPDYERGAARVHERAEAMKEDALGTARRIREPIVVHGDIRAAFDSITYEKGATVIGMFEGWIGEQTFRRGVQRYLRARPRRQRDDAGFPRRLVRRQPPSGRIRVLDVPRSERDPAGGRNARLRESEQAVDHARATTPLTRRGAPQARAALADPDVRALPVGRDFEAGVHIA